MTESELLARARAAVQGTGDGPGHTMEWTRGYRAAMDEVRAALGLEPQVNPMQMYATPPPKAWWE